MSAQVVHTVVVVSDDREVLDSINAAIGSESDYRLIECRSAQEAWLRLNEIQAHLIVADCRALIGVDPDFLVRARITHPHVGRVMIADPELDAACAAMARQAAAYLYVLKPASPALIKLVAVRALEMAELSRRHRLLSRELKISIDDQMFFPAAEPLSVKGGWSQFERLVFVSAKMAELCDEARRAAKTELPVLIHGETGTGKELLARAIHFNSARMRSPLHVQNCGGLSDDTLHSELFGHVRGAFTGAIANRMGLFRAADGGTVFLDEISEVSPRFQVSLLRFLQEREIKPLGSDKVQFADVRIIAASNRPLAKLVERGEFRRDLFYRLKGFELLIPPLRERNEDVAPLAQFFVEKYAGVVGRRVLGLTADALARLRAYAWPGNVRELETEIRRMVAIAEQGGYISARHLSQAIGEVDIADAAAGLPAGGNLKDMVEALERQAVSAALRRHQWNQTRVANELGLSRVGLANKIKRYSLEPR